MASRLKLNCFENITTVLPLLYYFTMPIMTRLYYTKKKKVHYTVKRTSLRDVAFWVWETVVYTQWENISITSMEVLVRIHMLQK
jgi:hypothetical protein